MAKLLALLGELLFALVVLDRALLEDLEDRGELSLEWAAWPLGPLGAAAAVAVRHLDREPASGALSLHLRRRIPGLLPAEPASALAPLDDLLLGEGKGLGQLVDLERIGVAADQERNPRVVAVSRAVVVARLPTSALRLRENRVGDQKRAMQQGAGHDHVNNAGLRTDPDAAIVIWLHALRRCPCLPDSGMRSPEIVGHRNFAGPAVLAFHLPDA